MEKVNENKWVAPSGAFAGFFALVGSSCCVLPLILINLGMSGAVVSYLGYVGRVRYWFLGLAVLLISLGVFYAFRSGNRPTLKTKIMLSIAVLMVIIALVLPSYEGVIQQWIRK